MVFKAIKLGFWEIKDIIFLYVYFAYLIIELKLKDKIQY
jgi:hypothetical protein